MSPLSLLIVVLLVAFLVLVGRAAVLFSRRPSTRHVGPEKYVIVDGSNVMHWGGEASLTVLNTVPTALANRN